MTRLLLVSLAAGMLLYVVPATAPVSIAGAALAPHAPVHRAAGVGGSFDVRIGDGIFRLRIRGCDTCPASVTLEIKIPRFLRGIED